MVRLFAAVLGLSLCLLMVSSISPVAFGGDVVEVVNGDTNGDEERDISDATYYLRWLFRGGPDPVAIICPEDLGAMVTELEGALSAANDALAAVSSENETLAGQAAGLGRSLSRPMIHWRWRLPPIPSRMRRSRRCRPSLPLPMPAWSNARPACRNRSRNPSPVTKRKLC